MNTEISLMPSFYSFLKTDVGLRTGTGSGIGDALVTMLARVRSSNSGETADLGEWLARECSVPEILHELKTATGLSWSQLGEMFDVSRRAVYDWLEGKAIADHNYERLRAARKAIASKAFSSPFQARTFLLFGDADGTTPVQLLKEGRYSDFARSGQGDTMAGEQPFVTVADQLNARQEAVHTDLPGKRRSTASRRRTAD
jgi:transcriptional regulator with XRE-family HTH domain